jgi:hypothetical protein
MSQAAIPHARTSLQLQRAALACEEKPPGGQGVRIALPNDRSTVRFARWACTLSAT